MYCMGERGAPKKAQKEKNRDCIETFNKEALENNDGCLPNETSLRRIRV